jgi:hypothetical protein
VTAPESRSYGEGQGRRQPPSGAERVELAFKVLATDGDPRLSDLDAGGDRGLGHQQIARGMPPAAAIRPARPGKGRPTRISSGNGAAWLLNTLGC